MKDLFPFLFSLLFISATLLAQDATEIIKKADEKMHGVNSSYTEMKMTIIRPTWKREMTMKTWSKGDDYSLILVTGPARDKGIAYLKRKNEMWNWQPTIDRVVKMPPSMMTQSWMGSDFTNDDLVRQSSMVNDYTHKLLGSETIEGRDCHKIELTPTDNSSVVWGKLIMWVDKAEYINLKVEYYDEDDYLVNTMLGKNLKTIGGRFLATVTEIIPADEPGHKTRIEQVKMEFDKTISDDIFSIQYMKRAR